MTRDEAYKKANDGRKKYKIPHNEVRYVDWLIDCLEALGVLKLETNENADTLLAAVKVLTGSRVGVTERGFCTGEITETTAMWIIAELGRKGFKITKELA